MTKKIRKFFNEKGEETKADIAEYAIELEFSEKGRLLQSRRYEVTKKKSTKSQATQAVVTVLERIEAGPGTYRYVVGLPFGTAAKAAPKGEGHWVTIRGRPVFIGGPRRVQVGITSYRAEKGQTPEQMKKDMEELERDLKETGVKNLSVKLGTGGWEGGSEPTFVVQFEGDGAARRVLAKKAKEWDQDAVIIMEHIKTGGHPQTRISFGEALKEKEYRAVERGLLDASSRHGAGIGGWTWGRDAKGNPVLIMQCIPKWGGVPDKHVTASKDLLGQLKEAGFKATLKELKSKVEVWEKEAGDYDKVLEG